MSFSQLCTDLGVKAEPKHISDKLGKNGEIIREILENQEVQLKEHEHISVKAILQRGEIKNEH